MKRLHDLLSQKAKFYRDWHGHSLANATHWSAFIAVSMVMTASLLSSINAYAQTVDGQASSTMDSASSTPDTITSNSTTTEDTQATSTAATTVDAATSTTDISNETVSVVMVTEPIVSTTTGTTSPAISTTTQNNNDTPSSVITVTSSSTATITNFSIPNVVMNSLVVPITHFEISDPAAVTGYLITNSATIPASDDPAWSPNVPTTYVSPTGGTKTLYAWVKDLAGNVSPSATARVTIMIITN